MAAPIFLYPTLSEAMKSSLKVQSKGWSLYYHNLSGNVCSLDYKPAEISDSLFCIETDGIWDADHFDLCFNRNICISHFRNLFGQNGILCKSAKLGISVVWSSVDSRQRGVFPVGILEVSKDDFKSFNDYSSQEISIDFSFPAALLRGDVTLSLSLYIAEPGNPGADEQHLANEYGFVLGELDSFCFRIDGTGSMFPIYEVEDRTKPLWYVICNWADPMSDSFSDTVSIFFNKSHKSYKYIDQSQKTFCKQLLVETMAAAVCGVVEEARNSQCWDDILSEEEPEQGSVAQAIRYFQNTLGWNMSSPLMLSESARKFFDRRMSD